MTGEDRKNAYLYCKFRDEQFALYDEYAKRHGMLMKTLLVVNALFYNKDGMTQTEICKRTFQSKQTVNLIIKNLLSGSYVTVAEVPENKRNKIVQMTAAGRAYCEKVVRHITWAEDFYKKSHQAGKPGNGGLTDGILRSYQQEKKYPPV